MKKAISNFNRASPSRLRWEARENKRLEHIRIKKQLRAKKEAETDVDERKPDNGRGGVHGSVSGE